MPRRDIAETIAGWRRGDCALYALIDPREPGRVRYVGTTTNPEARAAHHGSNRSTNNLALAAWKRDLIAAGHAPRLLVLDVFGTVGAAIEAEWRLIIRWQRRGQCDLNHERFILKQLGLEWMARRARGSIAA